MGIERNPNEFVLTITGSQATETPVDMTKYSGGRIAVTAGASLTTLTPYHGSVGDAASAHLPMSEGAITVAVGNDYELPAAYFGCHSLVLKGNNAGTVELRLKS